MGLWDRFRRRGAGDTDQGRTGGHRAPGFGTSGPTRAQTRALSDELLAWVEARPARDGVATEAWIEEPNDFNPATLLLVAPDGESRRWTVPAVSWAGDFCRRHGIPYHRGGVDPYPQRMRDFKARERAVLRRLENM